MLLGLFHLGDSISLAYSVLCLLPRKKSLVTDREMLLVIYVLEQWRHYLEGARHQFEIWIDHANLQWFMTRQDLNCGQARWAMYLSQFNMLWFYKPGHTITKLDALSRREDHAEGIENDNKGIVVITLDKIRTTILIADDRNIIKQKIFNATCLLNEADIQRLCKKHSIC